MKFFDAHAHYDDERFNDDRDVIIPEIYKSGITSFISAGYSLEGSLRALELAKKYKYIYTTIGISPNDVNEKWKEEVEKLKNVLEKEGFVKGNSNQNLPKETKIVAVGEIGLDYHYDIDQVMQRNAFIEQINLANDYNLPIVIHTREAVMDTIQILKDNQVNKKGIFHCCPFNRELVKEALKLGFYISICGPVTFKSSKNAEEIVNMIPIDRMLIETDSPYLAPEPVRGTRNDSRNVRYVAEKIANFKGISLEEVAKATYENAKRMYNI